jgi:membrane-bound ClpP family serine protease
MLLLFPNPPPPPEPPGHHTIAIGKIVVCTEDIDNHNSQGAVKLHGREYNARSYDDNVTIKVGQRVNIIGWEGNTIIASPIQKNEGEK